MIEKIRKQVFMTILACLVCILCFASGSFAADIPAPGTVINASNIDKYKDLFPPEFLPIFTDGWGILKPISIKVREPSKMAKLKEEVEASKKNVGKYNLDAEGYVDTPCEQIVGQPFYGVTPDDQAFARKMMWNHNFLYDSETMKPDIVPKYRMTQWTKRRGEDRIGVDQINAPIFTFTNRLYMDPKPYLPNRENLRQASMTQVLYPAVSRNTVILSWRPLDYRVDDIGFAYVPSLRRVLRSDAGERSTPQNNSVQAPDDFGIFAGRVAEFDYKLVEETKTFGVVNAHPKNRTLEEAMEQAKDRFPITSEDWEVRDVYVIDILAKDPVYPQSRKRIYMDKEWPKLFYGLAYDRAGKLWKVWMNTYAPEPFPNGEHNITQWECLGVDVQLGYSTIFFIPILEDSPTKNVVIYSEDDFTPAAVRKMAR